MPTLDCPGMRADNPLGFLAAVGFLRALESEFPSLAPRLAWANEHAVLHFAAPGLPADWTDRLASSLKRESTALIPPRDIIKTDIATFRNEARARLAAAHSAPSGWSRLAADLQAGLATDALPPKPKENTETQEVAVTQLNFTAGGKKFLVMIRTLYSKIDGSGLSRAIDGKYDSALDKDLPTMRWDPQENQQGAYRATNPDGAEKTTPRFLQSLAYIGLASLAVIPLSRFAQTTGMSRTESHEFSLRWCAWITPLFSEEIATLLRRYDSVRSEPAWQSIRMKVGDQGNVFFSPAVAVPLV